MKKPPDISGPHTYENGWYRKKKYNKMFGARTSTRDVSGTRSSQPRLKVILNEYDQPIGNEASTFTNFLGTIARPIERDCVDATKKETRVTQFVTFLDYWKSELGQIRSTLNKEICAQQKMPHIVGTKSFALLCHEMQLQGKIKAPLTHAIIRTHTHKDGQLVDVARQQINEMNARMAELPEGFQNNTGQDDVYSLMRGKRYGRVRGLGLGPTPTPKFVRGSLSRGGSSTNCEVLSLLVEVADLKIENKELRNKLGDVMTNQQKTEVMVTLLEVASLRE